MNYETLKKDGVTIIRINLLKGTLEHSKEFRTYLLNEIEENKTEKLIVDFSIVDFADSSFLGSLVSGLKAITKIKGDIKVLGLNPPTRAMFELTRLYKVFEIFDDEEDAVLSF